ncbi:elongator complex subunit Elp2 [Schizosaccharomyces cryophilus OY26]|uniref:Elongator complex protein 2 n=1 Tax=Schizosaccharomyces cryophilus (strain OY26 / ATCC MYA-4695 / CBS 11777 / NBRC 106824 / NRRL Y48691) TaxID=653667 RepID=S9VUF5_SCHCR|nr:elongator complex subunit Elp2 [Schizosaccharomyces cryophilus OY26]EPY49740.1 elongator complex subunit Elp2 [Schizosaccharomyces cryophilus OY26]
MFRYETLHAGCNRISEAATWTNNFGLVYGAEKLIAIADPQKEIQYLLAAHTGRVNCIQELNVEKSLIISGSSDKTLRVWEKNDSNDSFDVLQTINLDGTPESLNINGDLVVVGCTNSKCVVFQWKGAGKMLEEASRFDTGELIPMDLKMIKFKDGIVLVVCGSNKRISVYGSDRTSLSFGLKTVLTGHLDWVRSLSIRQTSESMATLVSGSQDRYMRLWKISLWEEKDEVVSDEFAETLLSNKPIRFMLGGVEYKIVFDALLMGHEDWIMSVQWHPKEEIILSSSADSSLIVWEPDVATGIWLANGRMGEIASSHGSTTATGSAGGFWGGFWSPDGNAVACWGRTGGWRLWHKSGEDWEQLPCVSGHTKPVKGIAWDPQGQFFFTVSLDQTTRLYACYEKDNTWREMARPQIHGYDLTSIQCLPTRTGFISCADEKVTRVFEFPKTIARLLSRLCRTQIFEEKLPEAANVPLLGLSNKATTATETGTVNADEIQTPLIDVIDSLHHPPFEEHLQRLLLFPEIEKIYGHGYEVFACDVSHRGDYIATSCKSQSPEHAMIRLFDTNVWKQQQLLSGHSLTVTTIKFSYDDKYLLTAGRDRLVCIHEFSQAESKYLPYVVIKAHSRIIWDAAWAPKDMGYLFATASRDKMVKFWQILDDKKVKDVVGLQFADAVTALDIAPFFHDNHLLLAVGTESGKTYVWKCPKDNLTKWTPLKLPDTMSPKEPVNKIAWRPIYEKEGEYSLLLAGEDTSIRMLRVQLN